MKPKITLCFVLVLGLLLISCATESQPGIFGRWAVSDTDDIITLAKGHKAVLNKGGMDFKGTYRMAAHDLLILTLSNGPTEFEIPYLIAPDAWLFRRLRVMGNSNFENRLGVPIRQGTYDVVTNAINKEDWNVLRGLAKKGMRANDYIPKWEKNPVRVGKLISVEKDFKYYLDGKPCTIYSFDWESKDQTANIHQLQVLIREEDGKSTILDFWNFGW